MAFNSEVLEEFGCISDGGEGKFSIYLMEVSWNGGEPKKELRKYDKESGVMGKGVRLTENELNTLTNLLLSMGYGDVDDIEKRKDRTSKLFDYNDDIETLNIRIKGE